MRALTRGLAIALLVPVVAQAQADNTLKAIGLVSGIYARVQLQNAGLVILDTGTEQPSDFDKVIAKAIAQIPTPNAPVESATLQRIPVDFPPPGQIGFHFAHIQNGTQSLLVIENGYDRALAYRARVTVGGRTRATGVCLLPPHARGYEHWPFVIERIELSSMRLVDWNADKQVPCA